MAELTIYRVTKAVYASTAFRGSRGRGRWHEQGIRMVYAADHPATALLETMVHVDRASLLSISYVAIPITLDDEAHLVRLRDDDRPSDWRMWPWPESTQRIGTAWFESQVSVALEVPSAALPLQRNYLINPLHPQFEELGIGEPVVLDPDARL
ncbi:MAG: RES family NAD+ phosphorylase [Bacteroidota bacterium]